MFVTIIRCNIAPLDQEEIPEIGALKAAGIPPIPKSSVTSYVDDLWGGCVLCSPGTALSPPCSAWHPGSLQPASGNRGAPIGGERRRQISPHPKLCTLSISSRHKQKSEPDRSPSLPSLLIRTDWWGRSPGRAAGVCQPSPSSCVPGRLQTKHSVAREGREVGVEYERQMDRFMAMVVWCSCRVNCHVPGHKQKGKLFTLMLRWRRVCPVLDNCAFAKQSIIQLLCPPPDLAADSMPLMNAFWFLLFLKKRR